jgi:hypothetical protein
MSPTCQASLDLGNRKLPLVRANHKVLKYRILYNKLPAYS